jgi:choline kinase
MRLQGAIIAAGRGERLRAAASGLPKPLVKIGGETMLARQARAMIAAGAAPIIAVVNSETARLIAEKRPAMPPELRIMVRDTANSMESLFALGEQLEPGLFLLATVDAVIPPSEMARFKDEALARTAARAPVSTDGALGVARWRAGDDKPLYAEVTTEGLIARLGADHAQMITAGIYMLPTRIFEQVPRARQLGLDALRRFLAMLIENGFALAAIEIAGAIDVDDAAGLEAARLAIEKLR